MIWWSICSCSSHESQHTCLSQWNISSGNHLWRLQRPSRRWTWFNCTTLLDVPSSLIWESMMTISDLLIYLQYTNAPYFTVLPPGKHGFLALSTINFAMYKNFDTQVGNYCPHCNKTVLDFFFTSLNQLWVQSIFDLVLGPELCNANNLTTLWLPWL